MFARMMALNYSLMKINAIIIAWPEHKSNPFYWYALETLVRHILYFFPELNNQKIKLRRTDHFLVMHRRVSH